LQQACRMTGCVLGKNEKEFPIKRRLGICHLFGRLLLEDLSAGLLVC
jgi:hypothetical protein